MDDAAGPSDGMMTALLVKNDNAQERLAVLKTASGGKQGNQERA